MPGEPQYMEGDPLANAERLLAGVVADTEPRVGLHLTRGEWADLEVALAELRRAQARLLHGFGDLA